MTFVGDRGFRARAVDFPALHVVRRRGAARKPLFPERLSGDVLSDATARVNASRSARVARRSAVHGEDARQPLLCGEIHLGNHPTGLGAAPAGRAHRSQRPSDQARHEPAERESRMGIHGCCCTFSISTRTRRSRKACGSPEPDAPRSSSGRCFRFITSGSRRRRPSERRSRSLRARRPRRSRSYPALERRLMCRRGRVSKD